MRGTHRLTLGTLLVLALVGMTGGAAACGIDCDPDGIANPDANYAGAHGHATDGNNSAMGETGVSTPQDLEEEQWGWFGLCLTIFVQMLQDLGGILGMEVPETHVAADGYVSTDGVDLDANVAGVDFDKSALGHLDGTTWDAMSAGKAAAEDPTTAPGNAERLANKAKPGMPTLPAIPS